MPIIRIEMLPGRTIEQKREVAEVFTAEICRIANCTPTDVNVVFADIAKSDWAFAGKLTSDD